MFVDFDDIDLSDPTAVYVQIAERRAVIDRLEGEAAALEHAYGAATVRRRGERPWVVATAPSASTDQCVSRGAALTARRTVAPTHGVCPAAHAVPPKTAGTRSRTYQGVALQPAVVDPTLRLPGARCARTR